MVNIFSVIGLGFGDEGKGATVDYLCRRYALSAVLRFNGGPQAAHHVVLPDGKWHCFSQFGSGTFIDGVTTHILGEVLVEPANFLREAETLISKGIKDPFLRVTVSPLCRIITPWNKLICQLKEIKRGQNNFGSVGMGVGDAVEDSAEGEGFILTVNDLYKNDLLIKKIRFIREFKLAQAQQIMAGFSTSEMLAVYSYFEKYTENDVFNILKQFFICIQYNIIEDETLIRKLVEKKRGFVFEGAQGTLLDPHYGFKPYITKTRTTTDVVTNKLKMFNGLNIKHIGVIRSYFHRHGNGPLLTEDFGLTQALSETHNKHNQWQGNFRCGWFDLPLFKYALSANTIDSIYLTNMDRLVGIGNINICRDYICENKIISEVNNCLPIDTLNNYKPYSYKIFRIEENNPKDKNIIKYIQFLNENLENKISNFSLGSTYLDRYDYN